MPADVNEMVLCDDGGELLEGMSSNFFAVTKDGTLVTADEGVLVCALTRTTIAPSSTEKPVHPPVHEFPIHTNQSQREGGALAAAGDCTRGAVAGVRDGRDSRATAAAHVE